MILPELEQAMTSLTDIQKEAVGFADGALLVLAGPGSGKTQVLTCRVAKLLDSSRDKSFRILGLTFTNKASDEMMNRVRTFVPGLEERATIGTFHSFCAQILRQHGVHLGIQPNFTIYSLNDDRLAILEEGLKRAASNNEPVTKDDVRFLVLIDKLKSRLIGPNRAIEELAHFPEASRLARVYEIYEDELRKANALDFNSLIFEAYRLVMSFPAIAARYRRSHPYWLIDEFQDTNHAQYTFLKTLAGEEFRNIFAVADDDQIIYQWNGANFRNIQQFLADFSAKSIQLPTNYRCPPAIVEAANHLVAYNAERTPLKAPLIAGKKNLRLPADQHVGLRVFENENDEASGIADEIALKGSFGNTAILARTKALLDQMHAALQQKGIASVLAQRRDDFLSPELRWFAAFLRQLIRPLDKRNMMVMIESFNRIAESTILTEEVFASAEALGEGYLETWFRFTQQIQISTVSASFLELTKPLLSGSGAFKRVAEELLNEFKKNRTSSDLAEDIDAWWEISREITTNVGRNLPLDQFLQELQLRSKEPTPRSDTVRLMTIHAAKGREFDFVFLIGLAEDVLPSYHSLKKGDHSPEMEEERRNCFVAITRTKECLILSRAKSYRGYFKQPSRFLKEMGYVE